MSRLFISHSSKDNHEAIAISEWLYSQGWSPEDVFVDFHDIGAGERWRTALRRANERCEAVLLLATPSSLASTECLLEVRMAEDMGKEVVVAISHGLDINDDRLAVHRDRQIVDLSAEPREATFVTEHDGVQKTVSFNLVALARIKARLDELGISPNSFAWKPLNPQKDSPFPGLSGFRESEAGVFFGRSADIARGLSELRRLRRAGLAQTLVIQAASGAGKSSYLKAGLWPRLDRDPDFVPVAILRPATGVLTGENGIGRAFSQWFAIHGQRRPAIEINRSFSQPSADAFGVFASLINDAVTIAHEIRKISNEDAGPPTPIIAVDQAEELLSNDDYAESRLFLHILGRLTRLDDAGADSRRQLIAPPIILLTIRADSVDELLHVGTSIGLAPPVFMPLPPISRDAYREIILRPAEVAREAGLRITVDDDLAATLVRESEGADALPLLAFTLNQLLAENRFGAEAHLTLDQYNASGGIAGALAKRLRMALQAAGSTQQSDLRRLFLPLLATWDEEATPPAAKRLVALEADLLADDRARLKPLADALVEERLLTRGGSRDGATTLEVAHEALLRQPPVQDWLEEDREFLAWRHRVSRARTGYEANERGLLVGRELQIARGWLEAREEYEITDLDRSFIRESEAEANKVRAREEERQRRQEEAERQAEQARLEAAEAAARVLKEKAEASRRLTRMTFIGLVGAIILAVAATSAGFVAFQQREKALKQEQEALKQKSIAEEAAELAIAARLRAEEARRLADSREMEAEAERQRAVKAEGEAIKQRDAALKSSARFIYSSAQEQLNAGNKMKARLLAMELVAERNPSDKIVQQSKSFLNRIIHDRRGSDDPTNLSNLRKVAIYPDSKRFVTISHAGAAIWEAPSGKLVAPIAEQDGSIVDFHVLTDNTTALALTDDVIEVRNAQTGQFERVLAAHGRQVQASALSGNEKYLLIAGWDGKADVWDIATGERIGVTIVFDTPLAYRLSSTGSDRRLESKRFFVSSDAASVVTLNTSGQAILWNPKTGEKITPLSEPGTSATIAFSRDEKRFAVGSGSELAIWKREGREVKVESKSSVERPIAYIKFGPNSETLILHDTYPTDQVYHKNIRNGKVTILQHLKKESFGAAAIGATPNLVVAKTYINDRLVAWSLEGENGDPVPVPMPDFRVEDFFEFSPDGRWFVAKRYISNALDIFSIKGNDSKSSLEFAKVAAIGEDSSDSSKRIVGINHDGTKAAFVDSGPKLHIFDPKTDEPIADLEPSQSPVRSVMFGHDKDVLAVAAGGVVETWNLDTKERLATFPKLFGYTNRSTGDSGVLHIGSQDETFSALHAYSKLQKYNPQTQSWSSLLELPDRRIGLEWRGTCNENILMFDLDSEDVFLSNALLSDKPKRLKEFPGNNRSIACSHVSNLLAAASNEWSFDTNRTVINLWNLDTGEISLRLKGHQNGINAIRFSKDGSKVLTSSWDSTARLWSLKDGKQIAILKGPETGVLDAQFGSNPAHILTTHIDNSARIWDWQKGITLQKLEGHEDWVTSGVISNDGKRALTASQDGTVRMWDARTGAVQHIFEGHAGQVSTIDLNKQGTLAVSGSQDGTARLWDLKTGEQKYQLNFEQDTVHHVAFSADGKKVIARATNAWVIWDAQTGKEIRKFTDAAVLGKDLNEVYSVKTAYAAAIGRLAGGDPILLSGHKAAISTIDLHADGRRALTGSMDGTARLWDVEKGELLRTFQGHDGPVYGANLVGAQKLVLTYGEDKTLRLWGLEDGKPVALLENLAKPVQSVAISSDGRQVAFVNGENVARIWSPETGQVIELDGHTNVVNFVLFSPDCKLVATASEDKSIRIWDAQTGEERAKLMANSKGQRPEYRFGFLRANDDWTEFVALADWQNLMPITLSDDSQKRLAQLSESAADSMQPGEFIKRMPRCLTPFERQTFSLNRAPPRWCITGSLDSGVRPQDWQPKWPYHTAQWREWLHARDRGEDVPLPR